MNFRFIQFRNEFVTKNKRGTVAYRKGGTGIPVYKQTKPTP